MIKSWIASTAAPLPKQTGLALWICGGALGLMLLSAGCGGVPAENMEGEESVAETEQAVVGSVLDYVKADDHRFELGLSNAYGYANPYYNIRYGILGSQLSTATNYGGQFYVDGAYAGAPYTFSARACDGYGWGGGWGNKCSDWSAPYSAYMPYTGSKWGYSDALGVDGISGAWGAGYYSKDGGQVKLPVCSTYGGGDQYLGYWDAGACKVGYGGSLHTYPSAQVLLNVPGNAYWGPYSYGITPHNAMKGGYYQGKSLYSCRTLYKGAYVPGWTSGSACNIGYDGDYYAAPATASQILCF